MKIIRLLAIIVTTLIVCYIVYYVFVIVNNRHHSKLSFDESYLWLINDSVKSDVNQKMFFGHVGKKDILYEYVLKNKYLVSVWEFKDLNEINLSKVSINQHININNNFIPREVLDADTNPEINIKLGSSFKGAINVNTDEYSQVIKIFDTPKYKGLLGVINKLSLSNKNGEHSIVLDYSKKNEPTLLLVYKTTRSLYVIFINSFEEAPIDENIMRLLDLS